MYTKLVVLTLIACLFALKGIAQETDTIDIQEEDGTTIKRYKYEVGTDIKWIFLQTIINNYQNTSHSYSYTNNGMRLFGRINKTKFVPHKFTSRKYAYRFSLRLNGSFSFYNDVDTTSFIISNPYDVYYSKDQNYFSIVAETGYEIQKQLKRFQLFYGTDIGLAYHRSSQDVFLYNRSNATAYTKTSSARSSYFSFAMSPLVGMKYFIHSRVSVSGEAKFNIGIYADYLKDGYTGLIKNSGGLNVWTDPLYALNVNYYFNR